jgi:hypothetical protein
VKKGFIFFTSYKKHQQHEKIETMTFLMWYVSNVVIVTSTSHEISIISNSLREVKKTHSSLFLKMSLWNMKMSLHVNESVFSFFKQQKYLIWFYFSSSHRNHCVMSLIQILFDVFEFFFFDFTFHPFILRQFHFFDSITSSSSMFVRLLLSFLHFAVIGLNLLIANILFFHSVRI